MHSWSKRRILEESLASNYKLCEYTSHNEILVLFFCCQYTMISSCDLTFSPNKPITSSSTFQSSHCSSGFAIYWLSSFHLLASRECTFYYFLAHLQCIHFSGGISAFSGIVKKASKSSLAISLLSNGAFSTVHFRPILDMQHSAVLLCDPRWLQCTHRVQCAHHSNTHPWSDNLADHLGNADISTLDEVACTT